MICGGWRRRFVDDSRFERGEAVGAWSGMRMMKSVIFDKISSEWRSRSVGTG